MNYSLTVISAEHVERLGREFHATADLMSDFCRRMTRSQGGRDSYGSLPDAATAIQTKDETVRGALDCLKRIEDAYRTYGAQLRAAARAYQDTEDVNADMAAGAFGQ